MVTRAAIDDFLAHKELALAGVSRSGQGFGNLARKELAAKGYALHLVHPTAEAIDGQPCVHHLTELAHPVDGLLLVTPPEETERLVQEADAAGIRRVWMQQGAESEAAIRYCEEHGMEVIHHQCVLMFAGHPGWVHRAHRWAKGLVGRLPS